MNRNFSISLRLTFWFSTVFLLGFVAFGAIMYADLAYSLDRGREKTLMGRSKRFTDLFERIKNAPESEKERQFDEYAQATPEGKFIQIYELSGRRFYPAARREALEFPWPKDRQPVSFYLRIPFEGVLYRVLSRRFEIADRQYRILVAGQLTDNQNLLARFLDGLFSAIPLIVVVSAAAGYVASRRALNPVDRLIASARSISIGNLSRRLPVSSSGDELARLAATWNEMLGRLENSVSKISRFTADASHELRGPIHYIRTVADFQIHAPETDEESRKAFQEIAAECGQAARLLDDLLTLARSDAGHAEVVFELVSLPELVREVWAKARALAEARGHTMTLDAGDGPMWLTGDPGCLRRLLWILLDNAIRYTPPGGRIRLSVARAGTAAVLRVEDNGVGIPPAALPHIFDRFFRVDASRSHEEGTGLGLAIAKWIADTHGAAITVESAERQGTVFQVAFQTTGSDAAGKVSASSGSTARRMLGSMTALD